MEFLFWIILVMIDLYRSFRPTLSLALKFVVTNIKNALPASPADRAPRMR